MDDQQRRKRSPAGDTGGSAHDLVQPSTLSALAKDSILVRIVAGEIAAGQVYSAPVLAGVLGVSVTPLGLRVDPACLPQLIDAGRFLQQHLNDAGAARHDTDDRLSGIYGVMLYDDLADDGDRLRQRSVTIFGDGQVDRSPCGSGTSARLALLADDGLAEGRTLVHESIIGTRFEARVTDTTETGGRVSVATEITGSAFMTGLHQFVLNPGDPLGTGFSLG